MKEPKVWKVNYETSLGYGRHVIACTIDGALELARENATLDGHDMPVSEVVLVDGNAVSGISILNARKKPKRPKGGPEPE